MTSRLIQDPFDPSEAIMPSGNLAAKVFFAPAGTPAPTTPKLSNEWTQIGWTEPGLPDTPTESARESE